MIDAEGQSTKGALTLNKVKNFFLGEPEKTLKKAGVLNETGSLTTEGTKMFIAWLFEENMEKFTEEVVRPVLEEEEEGTKKSTK